MNVWVVYLVVANALWHSTNNPEFSNAPDCWEWVDHQLESGGLKLDEGVRAVCIIHEKFQ